MPVVFPDQRGKLRVAKCVMPTRKNPGEFQSGEAGNSKKIPATATGLRRNLKRVARGTMFAAGLTAAQWAADGERLEPKLFSPSVIDRLKAPITRFHD